MRTPPQYLSVGSRKRLGLTFVELTVSIMVLTFAICAATSTVITTGALNRQNHETEIARRAAENQIEVLRNATFATVFATYDSDPSHKWVTDPHIPGNQGPTYTGLSRVPPGETFTRSPETGPQMPKELDAP